MNIFVFMSTIQPFQQLHHDHDPPLPSQNPEIASLNELVLYHYDHKIVATDPVALVHACGQVRFQKKDIEREKEKVRKKDK